MAMVVKCIGKIRNKSNAIIAYKLHSLDNSETIELSSHDLKIGIINNTIKVVNLKLTANNKLIDTNYEAIPAESSIEVREKFESILNRAKVLGAVVKKINTNYSSEACTLVSVGDTKHVVYIPDKIEQLNSKAGSTEFTYGIQALKGKVIIMGGYGLTDVSRAFYECNLDELDLTHLNTSKVTSMRQMFAFSNIKEIKFGNFDTHNVKDMMQMFTKCKTNNLDISAFDLSSLEYADNMFKEAVISNLKSNTFENSKITYTSGMFAMAHINMLDISNFNARHVTNMQYMFRCGVFKEIKMQNFNTRNVQTMGCMFEKCRCGGTIDLTSFDTRNVQTMDYMFSGCDAKLIDISTFKFNKNVTVSNMLDSYTDFNMPYNFGIYNYYGKTNPRDILKLIFEQLNKGIIN